MTHLTCLTVSFKAQLSAGLSLTDSSYERSHEAVGLPVHAGSGWSRVGQHVPRPACFEKHWSIWLA